MWFSISSAFCRTSLFSIMLLIYQHVYAKQDVSELEEKLVEWTVADIQEGYARNDFTIEEVIRAFLSRIKKYDGFYNAYTVINPRVIEDARSIDKLRRKGEKLGLLHGIPIIVKESIDVAGIASTAGWAPLSKSVGGVEIVPENDAPVVRRLRNAHAIIIGKGNIPAFSSNTTNANSSWAGPTYNAINYKFIPGGSSSGVATAVSGNFAVLGLAEETSGSIQNPAAAQSIVGIKPTFGLVPNSGVVPLAGSTMDVIGPHARTVRDAAIMLDVIAGYTISDPKTVAAIGKVSAGGYTSGLQEGALYRKRIGLYGAGWSNLDISKQTQSLYSKAIKVIINKGAIVVPDPFVNSTFTDLYPRKGLRPAYGFESIAFDINEYFRNVGKNMGVNTLKSMIEKTGRSPFADGEVLSGVWKMVNVKESQLKEFKETNRYAMSEKDRLIIKNFFESMKTPTLSTARPSLARFSKMREKYLKIFNDIMSESCIDALFFPQTYKGIPLLSEQELYPMITSPQINFLGLPAVVVPAGSYDNGTPFGVVFIGKKWSESDLLAMAYDFEQETHQRILPKLVITP